jgi:hypothetical protein
MEVICQDPPNIQEKEVKKLNQEPIIEKIIPYSNSNPMAKDKTIEGGDMEIELNKKEMEGIDLVTLKEVYHKKELLPLPHEHL